jgi:hypothetical protein
MGSLLPIRLRRSPFVWILLSLPALLAPKGCDVFRDYEPFECALLELQENSASGYFNAVVSVERLTLTDPAISRFRVSTSTSSMYLADCAFLEEGENPDLVEVGDVFVIPLQKPDWKYYIREENEFYCSTNFWSQLPVDFQWHPLKSEASSVAESIALADEEGIFKPIPTNLPREWERRDEKLPNPDDPFGGLLFQKLRADRLVEEVVINYTYLSDEEKLKLDVITPQAFLKDWTEWTRKFGEPGEVAGRPCLVWDMLGTGEFGWDYRYVCLIDDLIVEVDISANPLEWGKSEAKKEMERRTEQVALLHGFGPVGEPKWQILIEIRKNREGRLFKRSEGGITIEKAFVLSDGEYAAIERALTDNRFLELESRSGPPGGTTSSITVKYPDGTHTVKVRNFNLPYYQNIEQTIHRIVLPKVDETLK